MSFIECSKSVVMMNIGFSLPLSVTMTSRISNFFHFSSSSLYRRVTRFSCARIFAYPPLARFILTTSKSSICSTSSTIFHGIYTITPRSLRINYYLHPGIDITDASRHLHPQEHTSSYFSSVLLLMPLSRSNTHSRTISTGRHFALREKITSAMSKSTRSTRCCPARTRVVTSSLMSANTVGSQKRSHSGTRIVRARCTS